MHTILILLLTVLVCCDTSAGEPQENTSASVEGPPLQGTRVWISSFNPITTTSETFADWDRSPRLAPPEIPPYMGLGWQTNYDLFSKHLVSAAEKAQLDSTSLARTLSAIRMSSTNAAMLPVHAMATRLNGEPVWIVTLNWEQRPLTYGYLLH